MKYLFIVAHPDDEVLGAGGFIYDKIKSGDDVSIVILNGKSIKTRKNMQDDIRKSHDILGIKRVKLFDFGNLELSKELPFDVVPLLEDEISDFKPDYIFTHWDGDINADHKAVAEFAKQASRYTQRHKRSFSIRGLYAMEVQSSTDWGNAFIPNTYFEISDDAVDKKIDALKVYDNVLRDETHPRSERSIRAKACVRGTELGLKNAEAFYTYWRFEDVKIKTL